MICVRRPWFIREMIGERMGERLKRAREQAGFTSARAAASHHGWGLSTYAAHENGQNEFSADKAKVYGRAFKVPPSWLLTGDKATGQAAPATVPLVGYVQAGTDLATLYSEGQVRDYVDAPENATPSTVAVEVRGDSMGSFFEQWLVFYDDVRSPVTPDLYGRICVVGLADGRVLVKKIRRGGQPGLYHLLGQYGDPILDVPVEWAARVRAMVPR